LSNFIKILPLGAALFQADRQTDIQMERHAEAYSHFSLFCERVYQVLMLTFIQLQQNLNILFSIKRVVNVIQAVHYTNLLYCTVSLYELRNVSVTNLRVP